MTTYRTSIGERFEKSDIDKKVRKAKIEKLQRFYNEHGYYFCEEVGCKSPNVGPIDCSHDISVKECQETGRTELAWDISNITLRCRRCHQIHDKTYIGTI